MAKARIAPRESPSSVAVTVTERNTAADAKGSINLRIEAGTRQLIDDAAAVLGKTRTEFMIDSAKALSERLKKEAGEDDKARIGRAFELLYARPATDREIALGVAYLAMKDDAGGKEKQALSRWERYCQALLSTNEFMYVD